MAAIFFTAYRDILVDMAKLFFHTLLMVIAVVQARHDVDGNRFLVSRAIPHKTQKGNSTGKEKVI